MARPCCACTALDPKLVKAIEQDVVPHLMQLGVVPEAPPDLTRPDAGVPALTLVFDREGWMSGAARHRLHHLAQELQG